MKIKQFLAASAFIVFLAGSDNWKADTANAKVTFTLHGPFGTVNGSFTGLEADIKFDEKNLSASSISASIDAKTVATGERPSQQRLKEQGRMVEY